ncbi:MAG: aldehyde ferredoxin oxidoreductase family protein [Promethearchaeota archaeon]
MGKILEINLTTKKHQVKMVDPALEERYLGGTGVAAAIYASNVDPLIDPYDEKNPIIFSVGPFCGTSVPFCGRHFVLSKSPLTGLLGESSSGGFWGKEFKHTGYDHLYITGKSDSPVYISITDTSVEIKDAVVLWGKGTKVTEASIIAEIGDDKVKVSSIGPAGENLVKFASIMNERDRAAGRCGLGAVMGSKNLKAVVVRGKKRPEIKDKEALKTAVKKISVLVNESPMAGVYKQFGTPTGIDSMAGVGDVPIQNYSVSRWKMMKNIGANALFARGEVKKHACYACPVACTGLVEYEGGWVRWPEYETLAMLGSNILVDDLESIIRWNVLVNDLGMDTISLGGVLAMFLDAVDSGALPPNYTEYGFTPDRDKRVVYTTWGNINSIENFINLIAHRKGIGNDLAEGVRSFCEKYKLPDRFKTHVKGLEVPAHEPRANNLTALDYVTTPRGAFHSYMPMHLSTSMNLKEEVGLNKMVNRFAKEEAVEAVKKIQDVSESYSACGGCIFGFNFISVISPWVDCLNAITGRSYTIETWSKAGEDLMNLKRAFNIKAGQTKADDRLNVKFQTVIKKGGTKKNVPPMEDMLKLYYEMRKWDKKEPELA